ncbi:FemAB family XrtA/PEP-CTERM system-associated protein [Zavarzinella formosa]|uniref:FemAB family XrtA/PEP-CTERM system-associated protein n=1 Tax=Zavarzinella formosa TaxID=360055 RepID=UPI0002FE8880|nr:FemAB family XrtA/PEP-CTERM system-associated protein [Zavarzinella formosa]
MNINLLSGSSLADAIPRLTKYACAGARSHPSRNPMWMYVLKEGLGHVPYALEAVDGGRTVGYLPLVFVRSTLFGRFLVSLPYLNTGGVIADTDDAKADLISQAVELGNRLRTRHVELRHEVPVTHASLNGTRGSKVHMRLELPSFPGPLWESFPAKVRNQVRKGEKSGLTTHWGTFDLLPEFYQVFSTNMRDLGTPVYSQNLFRSMLRHFRGHAELCVLRHEGIAVSGAVLVHGKGITEVPSASTLRSANNLSANMLMYWNLLDRTVQRGQSVFDFGRATKDGNTYKFKKQWGAVESPAVWQYALHGAAANLRTDNPTYAKIIKLWQRLPVPVTRMIGPAIVRGIP